MSLLRKEQVITLIGEENTRSLSPVMELTVPARDGVDRTSLYDWRDVRALAGELGVDIHYEPAVPTTPYESES